ncbi:MAG: hypothetical protein ACKOGH_02350 [Alphaproteobacteria bacterium]
MVVADSVVDGAEHVPFNAGMLAAIALALPPATRLEFHAEATHREVVLEALAPGLRARISGGSLPVRRASRDALFDRALLALPLAARDPPHRLVLLAAGRGTLASLALLGATGRVRRGTGFAVLHAAAADLWSRRRRNPLARAVDLENVLRLAMRLGHAPVLVEPGIREEFVARLPGLAARARLWPHPLPAVRPPARVDDGARRPARLGFLGLAGEGKGYMRFVEAARGFAGRAEFHAIGHAPGDDAVHRIGDGFLATRPRARRWPREEFMRAASRLDYACLFHDPLRYRHVASGVLMDAMALRLPFVAPDIPLFAALFRAHGPCGFLYPPDRGPEAALEAALACRGGPRHQEMRANLAAAAATRAPEAIARVLAADLAP